MIDLKKIEEQIDALLESETPESLRNWADSHYNQHIAFYLGMGDYIVTPLQSIKIDFDSTVPAKKVFEEPEESSARNTQFAMAA